MNVQLQRGFEHHQKWIPHHEGDKVRIIVNDMLYTVNYKDEEQLLSFIQAELHNANNVDLDSLFANVIVHNYQDIRQKVENDLEQQIKKFDVEETDVIELCKEDTRQMLEVIELAYTNVELAKKYFYELDTSPREQTFLKLVSIYKRTVNKI